MSPEQRPKISPQVFMLQPDELQVYLENVPESLKEDFKTLADTMPSFKQVNKGSKLRTESMRDVAFAATDASSGLQTPEATLAELQQPAFAKHFLVQENEQNNSFAYA
jgi:hypothetical protein